MTDMARVQASSRGEARRPYGERWGQKESGSREESRSSRGRWGLLAQNYCCSMFQTPKAELGSGEISPIELRHGRPGRDSSFFFAWFRLLSMGLPQC